MSSSARSPRHQVSHGPSVDFPHIEPQDQFVVVICKLAQYLINTVDEPHSFDELRSKSPGRVLEHLTDHLVLHVRYRALICALLVLRGYFASLGDDDDLHLNKTRAFACEVIAWRLVTYLSDEETMEYLLFELPPGKAVVRDVTDPESVTGQQEYVTTRQVAGTLSEITPLIDTSALPPAEVSQEYLQEQNAIESFASTFAGLNALEIAAVSAAKKFLSQLSIQKIIDAIWKGDIVFWSTLSVQSKKRPRRHDPEHDDPYCRLRVPRYLKFFEVVFFLAFLGLYYTVMVRRSHELTAPEMLLWVWLAAFAYDEFGQYWDANLTFYALDFWSAWDFFIILIGAAYLITRLVSLFKHDQIITDTSFDILSLEALLLVPRTFSLLTLLPFFGPLIPCLKEMTKYSFQFMALVAILYVGFWATFTLLARDHFSPVEMSWLVVKVFFGSSYLGFDAAEQISPALGPPLMIVFVFLSNILLLTALISLLSNSITEIMYRSREEYLFIYSVYALESSTSNRLTYYLPPLNLLSLLFRPLRLVATAETLRAARIAVLKVTHFPHVVIIRIVEVLAYSVVQIPRREISKTNQKSDPRISQTADVAQAQRSPLRGRLNRRSLFVERVTDNYSAAPAANENERPQDNLSQLVLKLEQLNGKVDKLAAALASQE